MAMRERPASKKIKCKRKRWKQKVNRHNSYSQTNKNSELVIQKDT